MSKPQVPKKDNKEDHPLETIHTLDRVSLQRIWPHEARNFTPWLVRNIERLGNVVNMSLDRVRREVKLPGAGIVDITAHHVDNDTMVVIENQYGQSDDSHCLRLLGYAANADATILIWVAGSFSAYHRSILEWLNTADTIDVYAVEVRAYQAGNSKAASFHTVVEPQASPNGRNGPQHGNTLCAEFYRPVVARLRRQGLRTPGRRGWQGRWRSFESGYDDVLFGTKFWKDESAVFLHLGGPGHQRRLRALQAHQEEIDSVLETPSFWSERKKRSRITLKMTGAAKPGDSDKELEPTRMWMIDSLIRLRNVLQPRLEQVIESSTEGPEHEQ